MANEITVNLNATLLNPSTGPTNALRDSFAPGPIKITQATQLKFDEAISVTTADTLITFTGVTTQGYCMLLNLDNTNFVDVGPTAAGAIVPFVKLKPGEAACFRLKDTAQFRVQANTASCKLHIKVWND